jgi:hypothetical protein
VPIGPFWPIHMSRLSYVIRSPNAYVMLLSMSKLVEKFSNNLTCTVQVCETNFASLIENLKVTSV